MARIPAAANEHVGMDWQGADEGYGEVVNPVDAGMIQPVEEEIPLIDIISYAAVLLRYFADSIPAIKLAADVAVFVLPDPGMERLSWAEYGAVSVRVTHVGEAARPVLTWQCNC